MKKKASVPMLLLAVFVIAAIGLLIIRTQNRSADPLEKELEAARNEYVEEQAINSDRYEELFNAKTKQYIINRAKEFGYQNKGDIRYVIVNKEILYDDPAMMQEGTP